VRFATFGFKIPKVDDKPRTSGRHTFAKTRSKFEYEEDFRSGRSSVEQYRREKARWEEDLKVLVGHYEASIDGGSFFSQLRATEMTPPRSETVAAATNRENFKPDSIKGMIYNFYNIPLTPSETPKPATQDEFDDQSFEEQMNEFNQVLD
jgi:hypothetical protein